jgi:CRISPR system Cascade subunit CasD
MRLEGPFQSWGERGKWSMRDTAPEPTKSGIVGILACALGWGEDDPIRELAFSLRIGVRCDHVPQRAPLVDYHTVGGGYQTSIHRQADGKLKYNKGEAHTEQTWRSYLVESSFLIALMTITNSPDITRRLADALQNPVWPVYLGRKSCIPSRPLFDRLAKATDLDEALRAEPLYARSVHELGKVRKVRTVVESPSQRSGTVRRFDQRISRTQRTFAPRHTREFFIDLTPVVDPLDSLL